MICELKMSKILYFGSFISQSDTNGFLSYGMSLDCDLSNCFDSGQCYVARSRVRGTSWLDLEAPIPAEGVVRTTLVVQRFHANMQALNTLCHSISVLLGFRSHSSGSKGWYSMGDAHSIIKRISELPSSSQIAAIRPEINKLRTVCSNFNVRAVGRDTGDVTGTNRLRHWHTYAPEYSQQNVKDSVYNS